MQIAPSEIGVSQEKWSRHIRWAVLAFFKYSGEILALELISLMRSDNKFRESDVNRQFCWLFRTLFSDGYLKIAKDDLTIINSVFYSIGIALTPSTFQLTLEHKHAFRRLQTALSWSKSDIRFRQSCIFVSLVLTDWHVRENCLASNSDLRKAET